MKKNTLVILLIIPFIISLLTFVSVVILNNAVAVDIDGIRWSYASNEGYQIDENNGYELEAEPIINDTSKIIAKGNNLVWSTEDIIDSELVIARVENTESGKCKLYALNEGEINIVCSNERGSVSRHFKATVFKDGAMVINPVRKESGQNIDKTKYYATSDIQYSSVKKDGYTKKNATFKIESTSFSENGATHNNSLLECSSNVTYKEGVVTILGPGESYVTLEDKDYNYRATYSFVAIDGINIYNYNDLVMATNLSSEANSIVMQTNLQSLSTIYKKDETTGKYLNDKKVLANENTSLFGNFDFGSQTFSFKDEYYSFETTYESSFIDYYNESKGTNISKEVKTGIRLRGDLYGNGYSLNLDSLCYPRNGKIDDFDGKLTPDKEKDYFHGPLPFVSIGDLETMPLIVALGQDNSAIYVDSDGVTINDIRLSNVDAVDNVYNLSYVGTGIDVNGKNVTIKNSTVTESKVGIRAFDADNLLINNCIISKSGEFNVMVGSNKKNSYDTTKRVVETINNNAVDKSFIEFFDDVTSGVNTADSVLTAFLQATMDGTLSQKDYKADLDMIQKYLDNTSGLLNTDGSVKTYASEITINNTLFGRSGVFSIASESIFNGPFLYGGIPSMISQLIGQFLNSPLPIKMGGTSLPVHITLSGDTRFYDWKTIDSIDVSSLIEENISFMLQQLGMGDKNITVDQIFPLKGALTKIAREKKLIYSKDSKNYLNTAVAYYGGGLNISTTDINLGNTYNSFSDELEVSLTDEVIQSSDAGMSALLVDCVVVTIGNHPFRFVTNGSAESTSPILFDKVPETKTLKANFAA